MSPSDNFNDSKEFIEKNYHKVRDCKYYNMEYLECSSLKSRFNQYYIFGKFSDCSAWKSDKNNCEKAIYDPEALKSIIQHENERKQNRINNHLANDVWEKRKKPPANWNEKLPDYLEDKMNNSFDYVDNGTCVIS